MRIATYNVEWMDSLFDADDQPSHDDKWSSRYNVTRAGQLEALGMVFRAMDADAVMVIEAPDASTSRETTRALEAFAAFYDLRTTQAVRGFANDTKQEIALLYDPSCLTVRHDPQGPITGNAGRSDAPRFDGTFRIDLDVDATEDLVVFSKPPLELAVKTTTGAELRLIGAHLKSKAPHGGETPNEIMRISIANRRKQLAQAIWLRARISAHLAAGEDVILMGDLNDGPGLDEYESLFGRASVEIILGGEEEKALFDPHAAAALSRRIHALPTTSRFYLRHEKRFLQALLDYIMVSDGLRARSPRWRSWHPFDDVKCWTNEGLQAALLAASDHFPVTLDIDM